jgi:hypothetical protein
MHVMGTVSWYPSGEPQGGFALGRSGATTIAGAVGAEKSPADATGRGGI